MSKTVSFLVLVAIVILIAALFYRVMSVFLVPLFLSVLLVVMFRPLHNWFIARLPGHTRVAAGLTTVTVMLIVLLPVLCILALAANEALASLRGWDEDAVEDRLATLRTRLGLALPPDSVQEELAWLGSELTEWRRSPPTSDEVPAKVDSLFDATAHIGQELAAHAVQIGEPDPPRWQDELTLVRSRLDELRRSSPDEPGYAELVEACSESAIRLERRVLGSPMSLWLKQQVETERIRELLTRFQSWARSNALVATQAVGRTLAGFFLALAIIVVSLYYFLADGPGMMRTAMRLAPLDEKYQRRLLDDFVDVSRSVVVATLLSAAIQGLLAMPAYWLAGFHSVFLLSILTMLLAMIPFVGSAAVWLPCSLWLFLGEQRVVAAIVLAIYGAGVISMADNLVKPMVLRGRANLHPLLSLLSILGGVKALGPLGILVGPMIVVFLQTLLTLIQAELHSSAPAEGASLSAPASPAV